ncbi:DUF3618 domain-containing protein [Roseovarius sp. SCSIO 43702]|uniref:DUF3618 domain-containing protein n=1 Tax=Roseovarius sp. SCSIO 43702 TaxID=2823043 RepID=UPI001C7397D6|nr:DUF3618 domain-containing protein [Roseovarius sp. SCSIO 43702]QYX58284.1 DUF3618 domain-containing protein [Roseovarius sp. SCSIO 43702]
MTSDTRSAAEIEREIEREREGLRDSIDGLQDRLSFNGIVRQVGDQVREHGGDVGRSIARSVRENPLALTLTGVGLAWLILGNRDSGSSRSQTYAPDYGTRGTPGDTRRPVPDRDHQRSSTPSRLETRGSAQGGPGTVATTGTSRGTASRSAPSWARDWDRDELGSDDDGSSVGQRLSDAGDAVKDTAHSAKKGVESAADSVSSSAASARDSVASTAEDARDRVADTAQSVRDSAGNVWRSAAHRTEAMKRRVLEGTEDLSDEARKRIASARLRALEAKEEAARRLNRGADQVADFYDEHPLVAGALAFAVGAAIAGVLPRTRFEDENIGRYSDDLYDEAERIYEEEVEKARKVVQAGVDEARNVASEMKENADDAAPGDKTATKAAADKAKSAAGRVADAAKSKAEDEKLGDVKDDVKKS